MAEETYDVRKRSKTLTWLIILNQHQLRPFIECKTVVLRGLSFDFFEQVIVKPLLGPNSNTPEDLCYKILQKKKKNKKKTFLYLLFLAES